MLRAMDESGFDTLKATRALEAAGFESGQAEAMVTVFGGAVVANVATKWDVRDLKDEISALRAEFKSDHDDLRTELKRDRDDLRTELKRNYDTLRTELKRDIATLRTEFDAKLEQQISGLRTELGGEIAEVRLSVERLRASMYKLLLAQAAVITGLILGLQRLLQ